MAGGTGELSRPGVCSSSFWPSCCFLSLHPRGSTSTLGAGAVWPSRCRHPASDHHQMTLMAGPQPYGDLLMQRRVRPVLVSMTTSIQWMVSARLGLGWKQDKADICPLGMRGGCWWLTSHRLEVAGGGSFLLESQMEKGPGFTTTPAVIVLPWGTKYKHHAEIHSGSSRAKKCCRNCRQSKEQKGLVSAFM